MTVHFNKGGHYQTSLLGLVSEGEFYLNTSLSRLERLNYMNEGVSVYERSLKSSDVFYFAWFEGVFSPLL